MTKIKSIQINKFNFATGKVIKEKHKVISFVETDGKVYIGLEGKHDGTGKRTISLVLNE